MSVLDMFSVLLFFCFELTSSQPILFEDCLNSPICITENVVFSTVPTPYAYIWGDFIDLENYIPNLNLPLDVNVSDVRITDMGIFIKI